jgi:hypothetical protein
MKVSKILVTVVGACLIPITGMVFMEKADAYQRRVASWPTKPSPGKCTTVINVSSSGRDSWYWEVECGRNHSRKSYQKARQACFKDYNNRSETHTEHFRSDSEIAFLPIHPYAHNKCY